MLLFKQTSRFAFVLAALSVSGCAALDSTFDTLDGVFGVMNGADAARQICNAVQQDPGAARLNYQGKILSLEAQLDSYKESSHLFENVKDKQKTRWQENWQLHLTAEKASAGAAAIRIVGETPDRSQSRVYGFSQGQRVTVRGNVSGVESDRSLCTITLINALLKEPPAAP